MFQIGDRVESGKGIAGTVKTADWSVGWGRTESHEVEWDDGTTSTHKVEELKAANQMASSSRFENKHWAFEANGRVWIIGIDPTGGLTQTSVSEDAGSVLKQSSLLDAAPANVVIPPIDYMLFPDFIVAVSRAGDELVFVKLPKPQMSSSSSSTLNPVPPEQSSSSSSNPAN